MLFLFIYFDYPCEYGGTSHFTLGWGPYAYFHTLEELQAAHSSDVQNQQSAATGGQHIALSRQEHDRKSINDLESGSV
jgi:hypothetical protein